MEDWALIRELDAEGLPKAQIAKRLAISLWLESITWFRENVKSLRPLYRAAGSCGPVDVGGGRRRPVRFVVSAQADPAQGRDRVVVAGAGDDRGALEVHDRADNPGA